MGAPTKKPKASDRTVDMFTGATRLEQQAAAAEELEPEQREPFNGIEGEVDRWREQAFQGQEWTTKHFYNGQTELHQESCSVSTELTKESNLKVSIPNGFRLTLKSGWLYLERISRNGSTAAYHYAGLMMPEMDLFLLLEALLKASWSKDKESVRLMFREICK